MQNNTTINTNTMTFTFTDNHGDMFAYFRLNPTDPRLPQRCAKITSFFVNASKQRFSAEKWEEAIEKKFSEFLGYDCSESLFGRIAATSVMNDGRIFASHVLDAMIAHIGPELQKRKRERIEKYTANYSK